MQILNTSSGWAVAVGLIFLFAVHPVWSMVDCAVSEEHSKGKKVVWILVMFFTWFLSSIFYGIFTTTSRALRTATLGSIVFVIAGGGFLFYSAINAKPTATPKKAKAALIKKGSKPNTKKQKRHD